MKMLEFEMICTRMLKRMGMLMLFVVGLGSVIAAI